MDSCVVAIVRACPNQENCRKGSLRHYDQYRLLFLQLPVVAVLIISAVERKEMRRRIKNAESVWAEHQAAAMDFNSSR